MASPFERELVKLINRYSKENSSNTPDWILAEYLSRCLENWNLTMLRRNEWYKEEEESNGSQSQ